MSIRTFIILLLALALLGGLVTVNKRKKAAELAIPGPSTEMLLPPERLNDIAKFTVTVDTQTMTVAKVNDRWVVESLWNYPANFEVVADNLRKLADTKCGEIIRGGTERLEEFGLAHTTNSDVLPPATLAFYDTAGKEIRRIGLGIPRAPRAEPGRPQYPESAYVYLDGKEVRLVAAYLPGVPRSNDAWIDRTVATVPSEDVDEVFVTPTNGPAYRISRKVDGTFTVDALQETEAVNQDSAGTVAGALSHLSLSTVVDPATATATAGLENPDQYKVKTRDGLVYSVKVGRPETTLYGRYARIDVSYDKPLPPPPTKPVVSETNAPAVDPMKEWEQKTIADAAKAEAENKRLAPWTFVLLEGDCQKMTTPRERMVTVATNAPETAADATNTTTSP